MIPKQLKKEGFRFCRIGEGKKPLGTDWQFPNMGSNYSAEDKVLQEHLKQGGNYGVVTGFNNLMVIDFDVDWIYKKMKSFLPKTLVVKTGGKSMHFYYYIDDCTAFKLKRDTGESAPDGRKIIETLIDFQGKGNQVVGPGSIHSSGKKYEVYHDEEIATITKEFIDNLIKKTTPEPFWPAHLKRERKEDVNQELDEIKEKIRITDYDPTIKLGSQCCPFHADKNPSFSVFDGGRAFYCFSGCGGGSIFDYVMKKDGCDFKTAKEHLQNKISPPVIKEAETKEAERFPFHPRTLENMFSEGIPPIEWRVWRLLPKRGITFFGGTSGSYKTWVAQHLAMCISKGDDFLYKFPSYKTNVLYLDEENGDISLFSRFELLAAGGGFKRPFDNLYVVNFCGMKLDNMDHMQILERFIEEHDIKVVVVDSMVRCMMGQEDKASDVRMVFDNLKVMLEKRQELSIVILHHTTKEGKGLAGLRGSGDFAAFADIVLMFDRRTDKKIGVEVAKHRHVDLNEWSSFNIEVINKGAEGVNFGYLEPEETNHDRQELCKEAIINLCGEKDINRFKTGYLVEKLEPLGFRRRLVQYAIRGLLEEGTIQRLGRGEYEFYPIVAEDTIK